MNPYGQYKFQIEEILRDLADFVQTGELFV
jgi:UDP-glucose 4-epimerase